MPAGLRSTWLRTARRYAKSAVAGLGAVLDNGFGHVIGLDIKEPHAEMPSRWMHHDRWLTYECRYDVTRTRTGYLLLESIDGSQNS